MALVKDSAETSAAARALRFISQGTVISVDSVAHVATVDVGQVDQNGNPVLMAGVPFSPQIPPHPGDVVTLAYAGNNMHAPAITGGRLSGNNPQSSITIVGGASYQGQWNASTNTPGLSSSVGVKGEIYEVSVAGGTTLDGISDWQVGDLAWFNGSTWMHVSGAQAGTAVPLVDSGTGSAGTSSLFARQDHVHPASSITAPTQLGQILYCADGSTWSAELPVVADDTGFVLTTDEGLILISG